MGCIMGNGIGKMLIETLTQLEQYRNINGLLGTKDAHMLYEKYGFARDPERYMRRVADYLRS